MKYHHNSVAAAIFHTYHNDLILSISDDQTFQIVSVQQNSVIYKLSMDRGWYIAAHPMNRSLYAIGSDTGMIILSIDEMCLL